MVIDFHVHAFNPKIAQRALESLVETFKGEPLTDGTVMTTVQLMDEWGIDKACLLSVATKPTQPKVINDWAAEQDRERFIPFMALHPAAPDYYEELERARSMGLKGIKLHPDYQGYMVDDPKLDEFFDVIEQSGLPVVIHAGFDPVSPELIHCPPTAARRLFERHRDMKLVLAHMGGNQQFEDVLDILAGMDGGIYFDTAYGSACPEDMMLKIINKHGADRILFASDCPWDNAAGIKEKILRLPISDDAKELILGKNAERLLGI